MSEPALSAPPRGPSTEEQVADQAALSLRRAYQALADIRSSRVSEAEEELLDAVMPRVLTCLADVRAFGAAREQDRHEQRLTMPAAAQPLRVLP